MAESTAQERKTLAGAAVTLIVTGSIAAYKSAELVRELIKARSSVRVVMTPAAREFITPLTLQTLSGNRVTTELFDETSEAEIGHISLADRADIVLVAPATADIIAKAANGIADDAATTVLLATKAPIVMAPAMNVNMWQNPITQRNVAALKEIGVRFVEPDAGELACGWVGPGRLASLASLIDACQCALHPQDLSGCRIVVTAGPTREPLDPVRFLTNRSSGKMGFSIAQAAHWRGADVMLVSGPTALEPPAGISYFPVSSAQEMRDTVVSILSVPAAAAPGKGQRTRQLLFMSAAVADHRPKAVSQSKLKHSKAEDYSIEMEPAPDILKEVVQRRRELEQLSESTIGIVGFALESAATDEELLELARKKLAQRKPDLLVANTTSYMGTDNNSVWLLRGAGSHEKIDTMHKELIASEILQAAVNL